jgi:hypothetical protein
MKIRVEILATNDFIVGFFESESKMLLVTTYFTCIPILRYMDLYIRKLCNNVEAVYHFIIHLKWKTTSDG